MPLTTPNFTSTQSISNPALITFVDSSIGVDATLTTRRIYVRLANGNWLNTAGESATIVYETWPYVDVSIVLDLLTKSTTSSVTVEWYSGAVLSYSTTILMEWDLYDYIFAYELLQSQTATPGIIQDSNYYSNFFKFLTNLWNSENAVTVGDDLYSSQSSLNKNQSLIDNTDFYF